MNNQELAASSVDPRTINRTHGASALSWVPSANDGKSDFPVQNLPFGYFSRRGAESDAHIGVAIGDQVLDLSLAEPSLSLPDRTRNAIRAAPTGRLNDLMALDLAALAQLREVLFDALTGEAPASGIVDALLPMTDCRMRLPARIGDYSDFFTSRHHAANAARIFRRPDPLPENYHYLPIAYHGRASSICISGTPIVRPTGQWLPVGHSEPTFAPSVKLDYEVEVAAFVGQGNTAGSRLSVSDARSSIFGLVIQNDWSARDIQWWENRPLGPFLSKSFATTISPWVVTTFALAPFRKPLSDRGTRVSPPMHLHDPDETTWNVTVTCDVNRPKLTHPVTRLSASKTADLHWTFEQMMAHHTSNGCPMNAGDLFGSGTVSGPSKDSLGCLLELTEDARCPVELSDGSELTYLEDNDVVTLHAKCEARGYRSIGFGACIAEVRPAA